VALVLTAVVFTGLLQTSLLVMNTNFINLLRDEAVSIAEQEMNRARNLPFAALVSGTTTTTINRDFRGVISFPFQAATTVTNLDASNRQVTVAITWTRRGNDYNHNITTVVRQQ
jgi:hypothetical protein